MAISELPSENYAEIPISTEWLSAVLERCCPSRVLAGKKGSFVRLLESRTELNIESFGCDFGWDRLPFADDQIEPEGGPLAPGQKHLSFSVSRVRQCVPPHTLTSYASLQTLCLHVG